MPNTTRATNYTAPDRLGRPTLSFISRRLSPQSERDQGSVAPPVDLSRPPESVAPILRHSPSAGATEVSAFKGAPARPTPQLSRISPRCDFLSPDFAAITASDIWGALRSECASPFLGAGADGGRISRSMGESNTNQLRPEKPTLSPPGDCGILYEAEHSGSTSCESIRVAIFLLGCRPQIAALGGRALRLYSRVVDRLRCPMRR